MGSLNEEKSRFISRQFISFGLGESVYGLDILMTESIERISKITRVPKASEHVLGVINARGDIIPVISLRSRIGIGEEQYSEDSRIIITSYDGFRVGLLVDRVINVFTASDIDLQSGGEVFKSGINEHVLGIVNQESAHVLILDLARVLDLGGLS